MERGENHIAYSQARDIFASKADLAELETRLVLVKWMAGMMFGGTVAAATIASAVSNFINQSISPDSSPSIISRASGIGGAPYDRNSS